MLNSPFKIVAKILVNRLTPNVQELVGKEQTSFIAGRNIFDGIAIAHEVIHQSKKLNTNGYLLKLDFQKAYDMVEWNCLLEVLRL